MKYLAQKQAQFMKRIRKDMCVKHMETLFLYHSAPVLRKVKPATLITIKSECNSLWKCRKEELCNATGLKMVEINSAGKITLYLIYDRDELNTVLKNSELIQVLSQYGYPINKSVEDLIDFLKLRFEIHDFPHEIGLFLGYPPDDVKAFIVNKGKNYTCCRYWKVYNNKDRAEQIFKQIDEAQSYAIDVLRNLPPIHVAANLLKAN